MKRPRSALVAVAVLAAMSLVLSTSCSRGPRVQAGNLKEKREKKRAMQEAQRQALEEERRRELAARQEQEPPPAAPEPRPAAELPAPEKEPEPSGEEAQPAATRPPASPEPAPVPDVPEERALPPPLPPDYSQDGCRITLRRPDGTEISKLLFQPSFGYMERTFRTGGGVVDHQHSMPMFRFQVGLSLQKVKFSNLDRLEFIEVPDTRTRVRLRFYFRKGRKPEEYPAEELVGAGHPRVPVLQGLGTEGLERFPLFQTEQAPGSLRIVEVDFTP